MIRLLAVDDDPRVVRLLHRALEKEGYDVESCGTAHETMRLMEERSFDAVVLDVILPDSSGFEICRKLRSRGDWTPILMLTARGFPADRVQGLDSGADDYLPKPFSIAELTARLRSLLRRAAVAAPEIIHSNDLTLDLAAHRVEKRGVEIDLTPREFDLLRILISNPNRVLSRQTILDKVWDEDYEGGSNVVDVYVRYLRSKIDAPFGTDSIQTVRGIGYRWHPGAGAQRAS